MNPAQQARETAIAQSEGGADVRFNHAADEAVRKAAEAHKTIQTATVKPYCSLTPREGRAWAGVMLRAVRDGLIEPTNEYRPSGDVSDHNRPQRVYRSLAYKAPKEAPRTLFEDAAQNSYGRI